MINVGIIGFGKMGNIRAKAIQANGNGNIIAIHDEDKLKIPKDYDHVNDAEDIIHDRSIEAIFICTPNYLNKPLTVKGLNAGKHVFCEKPPAFNASEVEEVIEAEKASGKKVMYGFNHRHHSSIKHMKQLINSGEYGKILWMRGRYGKSVDRSFFKEWRSKKEFSGGGILLDQGIHMLDLFLCLGGIFHEVRSFVSNLYWKSDIEDNAFVILKNNETGRVASLHSTMTQWRHLFALEIFLEKGYMVLNGLNTSSGTYGDEILSIAKNRSTSPAATWEDEDRIKYETDSSWRNEVDYFFDAIINDQPIKIGNSNDALSVMRLIDRIYDQR